MQYIALFHLFIHSIIQGLYFQLAPRLSGIHSLWVSISQYHQTVRSLGNCHWSFWITVRTLYVLTGTWNYTSHATLTWHLWAHSLTLKFCKNCLPIIVWTVLRGNCALLFVSKGRNRWKGCGFSLLKEGGGFCAVRRVICSNLPFIEGGGGQGVQTHSNRKLFNLNNMFVCMWFGSWTLYETDSVYPEKCALFHICGHMELCTKIWWHQIHHPHTLTYTHTYRCRSTQTQVSHSMWGDRDSGRVL